MNSRDSVAEIAYEVKLESAQKNRHGHRPHWLQKLDSERRTVLQRVFIWIAFVLLLFYAISLIYPLCWIVFNSFKSAGDFVRNPNGFTNFTFEKYIEAFDFKPQNFTVLQMLGMTCLLAFGGSLATLATSTCAAYVMAKYKFKGKGIIFNVIILSMIVPIVGTLPSLLRLMNFLHLKGNPLGMIFLYSGGFGTNFLLIYSFFKGVPWSYAEAAYIDGASDLRIFLFIMLPLAKGILSSIFIIQVIGLWGDYSGPAIFLSDFPTLAVGLSDMTRVKDYESDYPLLFALITISITPILIAFILFSRIIMDNITIGGLKG